MATRERIELNFRKALAQADSLDEAAEQLENLSRKKFQTNLDNLSASWKGDGASLYMAKGNWLQEQIDGVAKELHAAAAGIRTTANRMYQAEMNAWKIATSRNY